MAVTRITILSFGVRGDVQPLLALSLGLKAAGFTVTLAADASFGGWIRGHGVGFSPLRIDWRSFLSSEEGRRAVANEVAPQQGFERFVRPMLDDCWHASQGADALIYDTMLVAGNHIAHRLGIPALMTSVVPNMSPTRAFPPPGAPKIGWGGWGNKLSYQLYRIGWRSADGNLSSWCQAALGFRPRRWHDYWQLRGKRIPIAYSFSHHVVPRPADWPPEYWAGGYWFLDEPAAYSPPVELEAFLAAGPAPLYIGFNSMVSNDPGRLTEILIAAAVKAGQRAVLVGGWGGLVPRALPDSVLLVDDVPHRWLFPRVSALVYHGGAGTTALGLRLGRPLVTCPLSGDQPFWGAVVARNGWGPKPISQQRLIARGCVDELAAAMRSAATDREMRRRVDGVSRALDQENGVPEAVRFICEHLGG
ncbi:MAG: glycosyltransferase [Opitutaceae bacterium]|jgi:sterol 3beta-glucosyltransferase